MRSSIHTPILEEYEIESPKNLTKLELQPKKVMEVSLTNTRMNTKFLTNAFNSGKNSTGKNSSREFS